MAVLNKYHGNIPEDAIWIMRGSIWGNPFPLHPGTNRDEVLIKYNTWLKLQIRIGRYTLEQLASLHNKDLMCCCHPKKCHGHSLEKAAKWAWEKLNK